MLHLCITSSSKTYVYLLTRRYKRRYGEKRVGGWNYKLRLRPMTVMRTSIYFLSFCPWFPLPLTLLIAIFSLPSGPIAFHSPPAQSPKTIVLPSLYTYKRLGGDTPLRFEWKHPLHVPALCAPLNILDPQFWMIRLVPSWPLLCK